MQWPVRQVAIASLPSRPGAQPGRCRLTGSQDIALMPGRTTQRPRQSAASSPGCSRPDRHSQRHHQITECRDTLGVRRGHAGQAAGRAAGDEKANVQALTVVAAAEGSWSQEELWAQAGRSEAARLRPATAADAATKTARRRCLSCVTFQRPSSGCRPLFPGEGICQSKTQTMNAVPGITSISSLQARNTFRAKNVQIIHSGRRIARNQNFTVSMAPEYFGALTRG